VSFDYLGYVGAFAFFAQDGETKTMMGDEVQSAPSVTLKAELPAQADRIAMYRNGAESRISRKRNQARVRAEVAGAIPNRSLPQRPDMDPLPTRSTCASLLTKVEPMRIMRCIAGAALVVFQLASSILALRQLVRYRGDPKTVSSAAQARQKRQHHSEANPLHRRRSMVISEPVSRRSRTCREKNPKSARAGISIRAP